MNYLSHYVYNHRVCGLEPEPYFAMGVALPDLWLRFSRKRRLRWRAVQAAQPATPEGERFRAGLLNHIATDRRFHTSLTFLRWQREIKTAVVADDVHPALVDFLVHMGIELALDYRLLLDDPGLVERFYDLLSGCDAGHVAQYAQEQGAVDTTGLDEVIRGFIRRRFIRRYRSDNGLAEVVRIVLSLVAIPSPPEQLVHDVLAAAVERARPEAVWEELPATGALPD